MAQYTSLLDILPELMDINHKNRDAQATNQKKEQERMLFEMQNLANFKGYKEDAKLGLLDKIDNAMGNNIESSNEKSIKANQQIQDLKNQYLNSIYGDFEYYDPNADTTSYAWEKSAEENKPSFGNVFSQIGGDVFDNTLGKLSGAEIGIGLGKVKDVLGQMYGDVKSSFTDTSQTQTPTTINNGTRDINYNYYAGKYPKQKGESDQAYIERLRHISLTE